MSLREEFEKKYKLTTPLPIESMGYHAFYYSKFSEYLESIVEQQKPVIEAVNNLKIAYETNLLIKVALAIKKLLEIYDKFKEQTR